MSIDVDPVRLGSSLSLQVRSVTIGGVLSARCGSSGDFFSDSACRLGLTSANRTIARLRPGIAAAVKDRVNDAGVQTSIADALKKYLVVGPGGEIAIKRRYERRKGTHDCIRPFERDWRIAGLAEHLRAERASWSGSFSVEVTGKFQRTRR